MEKVIHFFKTITTIFYFKIFKFGKVLFLTSQSLIGLEFRLNPFEFDFESNFTTPPGTVASGPACQRRFSPFNSPVSCCSIGCRLLLARQHIGPPSFPPRSHQPDPLLSLSSPPHREKGRRLSPPPISSSDAHSPMTTSVQSPPPVHLHHLSAPNGQSCCHRTGFRSRAPPFALSR
jgi:hypothetical protein